jgi:hypothetical protein
MYRRPSRQRCSGRCGRTSVLVMPPPSHGRHIADKTPSRVSRTVIWCDLSISATVGRVAKPPDRPSPPWRGAIPTVILFVNATWLLAYTLLALRPLEALGSWNYAGIIALMVVSAVFSRTWRGERYVRPARVSPPYRRSRPAPEVTRSD